MIVSTIVLFSAIYSARISEGSLFPTPRAVTENKVLCESSACTKRAQAILASMDKKADPCEDFYSFVCGKQIQEIEGDREESALLDNLSVRELVKVYRYLSNSTNINVSRNAMEALVVAFKVCSTLGSTLHDDLKAARKVLDNEGFSGWPILKKDHIEKRFNSTTEVFLAVGADCMFEYRMTTGSGRHSKYILLLGKPKTTSIVVNNNTNGDQKGSPAKAVVEAYAAVLNTTAALFNPDASQQELEDLVKSIIKYDNGSPKLPESTNRTTVTIKEAESAMPGFPLLSLINKKLKQAGVTLHEDDNIEIEAMPNLVANVQYVLAIQPDDAFNYFGMMRATKLMLYTSAEYLRLEPVEHIRNLTNLALKPPNKTCFLNLLKVMPEVITRLYLENFFDHSKKPEARRLLNAIGETYYKRLTHVPWMDHNTWKNAANKLWKMTPYVGYSDEIMDDSILNFWYKDVIGLRRNEPFASIVTALIKQRESNIFSLLRNNSSNFRTQYTYECANAEYMMHKNSMGVFAGILQDVIFDKDLPMLINLGALGFIMAHEITHGFDDGGRKYDEYGNINNWWSNYTRHAFEEKASCFVKQYGSIKDPLSKMMLNGETTLDENIADNAAVKVAFATLRNMLEESPAVALPGLENFTSEQLFFISFALPWCVSVSSASMKKQIETNSHAPHRYRVNVPLKNSEEFSAAFHCKTGSSMRLPDHERCEIW